jgi:hypothetical protein
MGVSVGETGVGNLSGEALLLLVAENLKRRIEFTVGQLNARKVRGEMKLGHIKRASAYLKVKERRQKRKS